MKIRQIVWSLPLALLVASAVPPSARGDSATLTNAKACRKAVDKQGRNYASRTAGARRSTRSLSSIRARRIR